MAIIRNISELIAHLEKVKAEVGDQPVLLGQLQANGKTVRVTGIQDTTYSVYGHVYLTNMTQSEAEKHLGDF